MFTATEFRIMREKCPSDLNSLLSSLNIPAPAWDTGDEFKICTDIDNTITNKLSRMMKSDSIIEGYMDLLTLAKIPFDYSETDNSLLNKVINNREAIIKNATKPQTKAQTSNVKPPAAQPLKTTRRVTQTEMSPIPLVAGAVLIVVGIGAIAAETTAVGVLSLVAGATGAAVGIKGHTTVREITSTSTQTQHHPPQVSSSNIPAPFTLNEIKQTLEILTIVNKLVKVT